MRKSIFIPLIILLLFISGSKLFAVSATCHEIEHSATPIPQNSDSSTKKKDPKKKDKWGHIKSRTAKNKIEFYEELGLSIDENLNPDITLEEVGNMYGDMAVKRSMFVDDSISKANASKPVSTKAEDVFAERAKSKAPDYFGDFEEPQDYEPPLSSKISNFFSKNIVFIIIIIVVLIIVFLLIVYFSRLKKADNKYPPIPPSSTPDNHNTSTATQQNLKYCTQCGKQIPANAKFCAVCGEKQ